VGRYGVAAFYLSSLPLCGLSYAMLALASNYLMILGFGRSVWRHIDRTRTGFMVWGIRLLTNDHQ